jgi:hypothetical protein
MFNNRWHHGLHWELDFPEALTAGREALSRLLLPQLGWPAGRHLRVGAARVFQELPSARSQASTHTAQRGRM